MTIRNRDTPRAMQYFQAAIVAKSINDRAERYEEEAEFSAACKRWRSLQWICSIVLLAVAGAMVVLPIIFAGVK